MSTRISRFENLTKKKRRDYLYGRLRIGDPAGGGGGIVPFATSSAETSKFSAVFLVNSSLLFVAAAIMSQRP